MKVSIIIPCYNAAPYLSQCLDSVLAQSMEDFEAIVIDDGSTDDTLALAQAYARKDARIRVLHQRNSGVSAARNVGLDHAAGDWVTFVDGDDLLMPWALAEMLGAAGDDVDMVVAAHRTFDEAGCEETIWPQSRWTKRQGAARRRAVALRLIEGDSVLNIMCNKLHRRALLVQERVRLVPGLTIAEDALFNLEAALCGRGVAYVHRVTYCYRMHAQSATHKCVGSEMGAHRPWLVAMRRMLCRRGQMETYFAAFLDSAVLRLYKDGGVSGVMRGFASEVVPLLPLDGVDPGRMGLGGRAALALCRSGLYPTAYPLIWFFQVVKRKLGEIAFSMRAAKEAPR